MDEQGLFRLHKPNGNRWECQQRGLKGFIFLHFKAAVASSNSFSWENWRRCLGLGLGGSRRGSVGTWQAWARAGLNITLEKGREEDAKGRWVFPGTGLTQNLSIDDATSNQSRSAFLRQIGKSWTVFASNQSTEEGFSCLQSSTSQTHAV